MSNPTLTWINDGKHDLDIAQFVIEGDPFVNHLVAQAADELRILTHYEHWGFAAATQDGSPDVLSAAVEALYLHLMADHRLFYEFEPAYNVATGEQQIQLPAITVQAKKGTCIDLTLLFLSCLAHTKLLPVYVQLNRHDCGHALAAAWIDPPDNRTEMLTLDEVRAHVRQNRLVVLECTGFVKGYPGREHRLLFRQAREEARKLVDDPSWTGWAVDVCRVWKNKTVVPLAPVVPQHQPWTAQEHGGPSPAAFRTTIHPFAAHIKEKTREFVGRRWVFGAIDHHLQDREKFPSGYILITGEPGIGKSAVMAQLVKERGYVHHFNIALQGIRSPKHFLTNVCAQLIVRYRLQHDRLPDDVHENGLFLSRLLQEASEGRKKGEPLVLVVDALDEAERSGAANPLFLPPALPDGVYVVATTRPGDAYRLSVMRLRELALDGRSKENQGDVREYIDAHREKEGIRRWMTTRTLEPAKFTDLLLEKSEGNFMYLYHVLQDIELDRLQAFRPEDLPRGLRDYYRRHWETMRAHGRELFDKVYEPVVCILGAVREAVTEEQVAEWTELEPRQVRRVVQDWREFLYEERGKEWQRLWRIYHTTFQAYLTEEVDPGLKTYHAMIARSALRKVGRARKASGSAGGGAEKATSPAATPVVSDRLHFSVTSPSVMMPGSNYLVDLWAHLEHDRARVLERAREESAGRDVRIKTKGAVVAGRGTVLTVRLWAQDLVIDPPQDSIIWEGEMSNATFAASVPAGSIPGPRVGTATVHIEGMQVARLCFTVEIGSRVSATESLPVEEKRHRRAFASYASEDRDAVLARIHGMQKAAPGLDVFLDVAMLRSGERWKERLRSEIVGRDVLYLFWSEAASRSKWVEWEWRCGLAERGIDFIDPVPLVPPDRVPPPRELGEQLHFNDWVLAYMSGAKKSRPEA